MDSFKEDQAALDQPLDFSEKQSELENKFKKDELKKMEKAVRKDVNEWDDIFNGAPALRKNDKGVKTLGDKINKIMKDSLSKSLKRHGQATQNRDQ